MNNFEVIILALALVFNSLYSYLHAGIVLAEKSLKLKISYASIMFLLQIVMAGAGIWLGYKIGSLEMKVNIFISLSILFIFGLKVLLTGIKSPSLEKAFDYTDNKVTLFAALAEGITSLSIGIAIGLLSLHPYLHWILIGLFLLAGIIMALTLAVRMGTEALKIRLGPVGGLLLLAAAIKLFLNITVP
jgi:putative Mn2+ efflux pump MntP